MAKKIITATINNVSDQEVGILTAIFGDRLNLAETADRRKDAPAPAPLPEPEPQPEPDPIPAPKITRAEGILQWKIGKYGSEERASRVEAEAKLIRDELADQWRTTGKRPVAKSKYKDFVYGEALRRVEAAEKAEAEAAEKAKKNRKSTRSKVAKA